MNDLGCSSLPGFRSPPGFSHFQATGDPNINLHKPPRMHPFFGGEIHMASQPIPSMGLVYLPTFSIKKSTIHVGKYTIVTWMVWVPMNHSGSLHPYSSSILFSLEQSPAIRMKLKADVMFGTLSPKISVGSLGSSWKTERRRKVPSLKRSTRWGGGFSKNITHVMLGVMRDEDG